MVADERQRKNPETGHRLLLKSLLPVSLLLATAYLLVMLTEFGVLDQNGWRYACSALLTLGLFCLGIYGEIVWVASRSSQPASAAAESETHAGGQP